MPMPYSNALSWGDLNLNPKSWGDLNFSQGSRFTIPLATATLCFLNSDLPVLATDLNTQVAEEQNIVSYSSFNLDNTSEYFHESQHHYHHHDVGFLSRIFNLIASPWQNHFGNLSKIDSHREESPEILHSQGMGGNYDRDFTPMYLALAESSSPKEFSIASTIEPIKAFNKTSIALARIELTLYTVKTGDTISSIAKKHQVSRKELIALNRIKNSNIIFVDQQLKLPTTKLNPVNPAEVGKLAVLKDTTAHKSVSFTSVEFPHDSARAKTPLSVSPNHLADLRLKSGNISKLKVDSSTPINTFQDDRLATLRSDIEKMRSEIKQEKASDPIEDKVDRTNLVSSLDSTEDFNVSSISEKAISLKLPPLPSSEEYLPEAFEGYSWPAQGVLSSGYGWRWGRLHKGIDIAAPVGTPIFAAAAGEVISAGWNSGGYGNLVKLKHLDGSMTLYAHNHRILVNKGQIVDQGEQIAEMGNTGFSTGSHLHFEIHAKNRGVVNPLAFLNRN